MNIDLEIEKLLKNCCEEIGLTVSGASVSDIPIQIYRRVENKVFEEDLVLIHDPSIKNKLILGVIRRITKLEPLIRERTRTPFIDKPEILDQSILMPFTTGIVKAYITLNFTSRCIEEVRHVITPGSKVYVIKDGSFLKKFIQIEKPIYIGFHKYSSWELPLNSNYVNYHIGIFGATGVGKSRLIKALIDELINKGFKVIVFDHTGVDYAPYFKEFVISSKSIKISPPTIASVIAEKARLHWQTFGEYLEIACITYATGRKIGRGRIVNSNSETKWSKQEFINHLATTMRNLNARDSTIEKAKLFIDYFIDNSFFEELNMRKIEPYELISYAIERGLLVIDLSEDTELPIKQGIIRDVLEAAWKITLQEKKILNLVFVIDEAQNYVPEHEWTICGDIIETTAREGRKWGLSLILASQRIAGDIRVSVRSNLGTVFFSKLSAQSDLREISMYLDVADVDNSILAQLSVREFFVAGLLNPLRKPILIKVKQV